MYRWRDQVLEVFLVHPGGPFWANRDWHAWSIPKGEYEPQEDALAAAKREVEEETGLHVEGHFWALTPLRQPSGKVIHAWAVEGDRDATAIKSNTFVMEWPPRSGKQQEFPEIDRAAWFPLDVAKEKVHRGQIGFFDELQRIVMADPRIPSFDQRGEPPHGGNASREGCGR